MVPALARFKCMLCFSAKSLHCIDRAKKKHKGG